MKKVLIVLIMILLTGCSAPQTASISNSVLSSLEYEGEEYIKVNGNRPEFTDEEKTLTEARAEFSDLDYLGRCDTVFAVLDKEHLAEGKRGSIGMYRPSGWPSKIGNSKYDFIDGKYLFNRSHLLGWQLWGDETNNEKNLITGTRQMNAGHASMLNYENAIAGYLKNTNNHVVYRVTPHFRNDELIARGVQLEAWSVEDNGKLHFNIYVFNVQDGVEFSYYDGSSHAIGDSVEEVVEETVETGDSAYYLNCGTGKFHTSECRYSEGLEPMNETREQLIESGCEPCKVCNP